MRSLIIFWIVLLVIFVLAWIWIRMEGRRRGLRNDHESRLTTAAKHFASDMDSRARETGPRWQAPGHER